MKTTKSEETIDENQNDQNDQPRQIDKEKPPFTVPLKELEVGKAGVSDLFDKINEVVRFLNALDIKPSKA